MKISIITVVYKDVKGLEETKKSIFSLKKTDYEWIICDGGTGQEFDQWIKDIPSDICWVSEPDHGIYDAMNKGLKLATGDYIVFMNAGDIFSDKDVLETVSGLVLESNADIILGGSTLVFPRGKKHYRKPKNVGYLWHGLPASHQSIYFKRESISDLMYDTKYKICGDYYFVSKAVVNAHGKMRIQYLDKSLVDFRVGDTSYKNPFLLMKEPYLIQRDVLNIGLARRCLSLIKRCISTLGFVAFSHLEGKSKK